MSFLARFVWVPVPARCVHIAGDKRLRYIGTWFPRVNEGAVPKGFEVRSEIHMNAVLE